MDVEFGDGGLSRKTTMKFTVIRAPSPYNVILGRSGLKALRAIPSTIHAMMKFPTPRGIATLVTRRLEDRQASPDEVAERQGDRPPEEIMKGPEARYQPQDQSLSIDVIIKSPLGHWIKFYPLYTLLRPIRIFCKKGESRVTGVRVKNSETWGEQNFNIFGGWLGKNSTMGKNYRLLEDAHVHPLSSVQFNSAAGCKPDTNLFMVTAIVGMTVGLAAGCSSLHGDDGRARLTA
ncbi:AAA+ ATPase domain-containing protein [Artemisia annua]|uniref:AAA+ ATPase domain-containing protein n=1 Tax=Artemisia annua TaxID=35608 RepID=A0A2U1KN62_ARTAN|nr:AAA+ ATPase domain-containing protein [Artemisia annua]